MVFSVPYSHSQDTTGFVVYARIIDGDTVPVIPLKEVIIYPDHNNITYKLIVTRREAKRMTRLVKNVKKVYPYAKVAGILLVEYEEKLALIDDKKERKRIIKQAEEDLQNEFGNDLRKMSFSQGIILIKLIDRETGASSYEIVEELRGKFRAFFYQSFARLFGYNLKTKYDPNGEDRTIEHIVRMIERGEI